MVAAVMSEDLAVVKAGKAEVLADLAVKVAVNEWVLHEDQCF